MWIAARRKNNLCFGRTGCRAARSLRSRDTFFLPIIKISVVGYVHLRVAIGKGIRLGPPVASLFPRLFFAKDNRGRWLCDVGRRTGVNEIKTGAQPADEIKAEAAQAKFAEASAREALEKAAPAALSSR